MRESSADTRVALMQAIGLHAVLFALVFAGLQWTRSNMAPPAQGDVIEADLVDPSALSAAMRSALQRTPEQPPQPVVEQPVVEPTPVVPQPEPLPEPVDEDVPPPPVPEPEPVEQERVQREAESPQVAKVSREQEEKRKQPEQADLDALKQKQLAEIRKQQERARAQTQMELQRQQQLADARNAQANTAAPPRGNPNADPGRQAQYIVAIRDAILRQWTRPESVPLGVPCQVAIRQIPGGEVVDVQVAPSCPYDQLGKRSLEAAIMKASPLPYAGFEKEFVRDPVLKFRAEDL